MLFKNITILDENLEVRENMYVGITKDRISYIGEKEPAEDYGKAYDGKGKLLMSGFFNAHSHSPMSLMRGYGENMMLQDWLNNRIWPFEDHLDSNAVYWGTMLDLAESVKFGTVSISDMYYFCPDMAKAYSDSGCKGNISRSIAAFVEEDFKTSVRGKECIEFFEKYHNTDEGRIKVDMSLHAEYTSVPGVAKQLADYMKEIGAGMQVHVSETKKEHEECIGRHGKTPTAYLADLGIFDTNATAAHCVWVTPEDRRILKEKNVTVACNPISNLKLASGVCNAPAMLSEGINVAIGTDSVASNNSHNIFSEVKTFALIMKCFFGDPTLITPKQAIYAATRAGAIAQGRPDCGLVKEGNKADLIVVDISAANMQPIHDLLSNLVYSASGAEIMMTMIDGNVLYENGEYTRIDLEKAVFEADAAKNKILKEL
ncbi:MAG: amidohydrolase [Firmicutes bacterium]|nr:amidohydrolase [Bacillota bacterium]